MLVAYANSLYSRGTKDFPGYTPLHIRYILFLIEFFNNPTKALKEIASQESNDPDLETQFLLYHYRQLIKEELLESKKDDAEKTNVSKVMAYESHLSAFKEKIEKTANSHSQFWSALLEDSPDLKNVQHLGHDIEKNVDEIDQHWDRMQEIKGESPEILKYYALFLKDIIHDKETYAALIEKSKFTGVSKRGFNGFRGEAVNSANLDYASPDGTPCISISGQQNNAGIITDCNMSLCRDFGYTKNELKACNISKLMPDIYAKHHQNILIKAIQSIGQKESNDYNIKDLYVFGKAKNEYIFPLWLKVFALPTLLNNSNFIALMHLDKKSRNILYNFPFVEQKKKCYWNKFKCFTYFRFNIKHD